MRWLDQIPLRLRSLFRKERVEQEMDDELRFHLECQIEENLQSGMSPEEARYAALRQFGGIEQIKEECREARGLAFLESLLQDLRFGLRQLRRNPGFTAVAVVTLALGIGLNTAIFSVVNALLFRPLPVRHPEQIYTLSAEEKRGGSSNGFSYQDFQEIRKQTSGLFSDMAGVQIDTTTGLNVDGKTERMWTNFVTGDFFKMLGIRPALGRFILPSEGSIAGADPVLVLGYSFWKARLGADPNIVGKKASVNGWPVTIVGVTPQGFLPLSSLFDTQGYMPLGMAVVDNQTKGDFLNDRQGKRLVLIARVKPGVTEEEIQSTVDVVGNRLAAEYTEADDWRTLNAFPLPPTGPSSRPPRELAVVSALFLTLASVVLILACVNVANILLVRASVRRGEIAIRAALGARRSRLIWQLLTESFLLALLGCMGGIVVGLAGSRVLSTLPLHMDVPIVLDFHFDWRVFVYAFGAALLAGVIAGIAPAWRTTGGDLNALLHGSGRSTTAGGHRFRKALVVAQVGGSLMLLIIAGLFVRSLLNVQRSDLGFDPEHVLNITLDPRLAGYSQSQGYEFVDSLLERIRAVSGLQSASLAATVPMGANSMGALIEVEGLVAPPGEKAPSAGCNVVSAGYFETMRIPLLRGRAISETDKQNSTHVAIINQAMAERFWPGNDPIGRQFRLKHDLNHPLEVVGVVKNSKTGHLSSPEGPYFYMAFAQQRMLPVTLQVRTAGDPELMARGIIGLIRSLEPAMPLADVQTMTDALDTLNGRLLFKLGAGLAAATGILGLILAIIGVYGVVSYTATERTHEIGIRLALGAVPSEILRSVLRQGMFIVGLGTVVGMLLAFGFARLVGHFLVGVSPTDAVTFVGVALVLGLVALAASYLPARRAAKVDPMVALRYE
jgi:putative ABC transport system permease protein